MCHQALVEIANRKLGLERALNGDGAGHEPTRDEVAQLLRCGAHDIAVEDKDDAQETLGFQIRFTNSLQSKIDDLADLAKASGADPNAIHAIKGRANY